MYKIQTEKTVERHQRVWETKQRHLYKHDRAKRILPYPPAHNLDLDGLDNQQKQQIITEYTKLLYKAGYYYPQVKLSKEQMKTEKRNGEIRKLNSIGWSPYLLSQMFGISRRRVDEILNMT